MPIPTLLVLASPFTQPVPDFLLDTGGAAALTQDRAPKGRATLAQAKTAWGREPLPACLQALKGRISTLGRASMVAEAECCYRAPSRLAIRKRASLLTQDQLKSRNGSPGSFLR